MKSPPRRPSLNFWPISAGLLGDFFGAEWPEWIRDLHGKSGIYVIRDGSTGPILYVGESHTGRLKKTLLRHFQSWSGKTAGQRYGRGSVYVAAQVTPPGKAVARQNVLILRLKPRDNTTIKPDKSENPF